MYIHIEIFAFQGSQAHGAIWLNNGVLNSTHVFTNTHHVAP
jgi:hypothetical protein